MIVVLHVSLLISFSVECEPFPHLVLAHFFVVSGVFEWNRPTHIHLSGFCLCLLLSIQFKLCCVVLSVWHSAVQDSTVTVQTRQTAASSELREVNLLTSLTLA
jgi:hypothetical protein